ncbi:hypothetical protein [Oceaniglobus roseus]|uniref:hypothetical protein n=1 Tax=Oceaniglobus roseus TaxID=1737570 RepID=UPI000C7F68D6|nr:hypothetical protein [Kandeliimicrobium roseum]
MTLRAICFVYFLVLLGAAALNYIPGVRDSEGLTFGIFELDLFDDALHLASALWALAGALVSRQVARTFLLLFGALYLADGAMGLVWGSGYLDFGIFQYGVQDLPFDFKVMANLPHLALGGMALLSGLFLDRR